MNLFIKMEPSFIIMESEKLNNIKDALKVCKDVIEKQQEILELQEQEKQEMINKQKVILERFNSLPTVEELYQQTLREKADKHKYRVKLYNQFIFKHGMQEFTNLLVKAHDNQEYLQNFHEFIDFCNPDVKDKIESEFSKREKEMMSSVYKDFMPFLDSEKVVNHMVYLDEDFGPALDELDNLLTL